MVVELRICYFMLFQSSIIFIFVIIIMTNIKPSIFNFLLDKINFLYQLKRISKYTNKCYLEKILFILQIDCTFREVNFTSTHNHYSYIHKKFKLWSGSHLFDHIYNDLLLTHKKKNFKKSSVLKLFIDSASIRNKNGIEFKGRNYQDKHKYGNKVTVICDEYNFPLQLPMIKPLLMILKL
jgi:hypothetical protein